MTIEEILEAIESRIQTEMMVIELKTPGEYEWEVPKNVKSAFVCASAGGGSGESLIDYLPTGTDGEDTVIGDIVLKGGLSNMVASTDDQPGNGEDSLFAKGGIPPTSENWNTANGEKGSGGCGISYRGFITNGGGKGEAIQHHKINNLSGALSIKVGKGGKSPNAINSSDAKAGSGGDGFVKIVYAVSTVKESIEAPIVKQK